MTDDELYGGGGGIRTVGVGRDGGWMVGAGRDRGWMVGEDDSKWPRRKGGRRDGGR